MEFDDWQLQCQLPRRGCCAPCFDARVELLRELELAGKAVMMAVRPPMKNRATCKFEKIPA